MHTAQWEFGFGDMKKTGHVVKLPRKRLPAEERDRRIVELRQQGFVYDRIKEQARCSDATISLVLRRDAPELLSINHRKEPRKEPPPPSLALPPTKDEPLAKIGVHFWDMPVFGQCKFIVAKDPDDKLARYCGEGTVTFGCSWCAEHLALVALPRKKFIAEAA
jgi:hypothetical protein